MRFRYVHRLKITIFIWLYLSTVVADDLIKPIPYIDSIDQDKALLGKRLFFDTRLSRDNSISCASCHILSSGGDDNLRFSFGIDGQKGNINSPTVYNTYFNFRQFWNGRAKDLKEQAKGPIENPVEMGSSHKEAVKSVKRDYGYQKSFQKIYTDGITIDNIADAISEFEKALITVDAPFDLYLRGDKSAIDNRAKEGYRLFVSKGCIICHHGVNVGGNMYNKFGIFKGLNSSSLGRYSITKRDEDRYLFKVPSLRNIDQTAPYMHSGEIKTLDKAVRFMAQYQLGRDMKDEEIDAIVAFLKTLTGKVPDIAK
jgi:cytochrome c peroxidase